MGVHCSKNHGDGYEKDTGNELDFIGALDVPGNRNADGGAFGDLGAASAFRNDEQGFARLFANLGELIRIPILRGIS